VEKGVDPGGHGPLRHAMKNHMQCMCFFFFFFFFFLKAKFAKRLGRELPHRRWSTGQGVHGQDDGQKSEVKWNELHAELP